MVSAIHLFQPALAYLTPASIRRALTDLTLQSSKDSHDRFAELTTSTDAKLPFFSDPASLVGKFVLDLIDFRKTTTLESSFIGTESEGNGLWQYISVDGRIFPSYMLHRTVTGRTASAAPNARLAQNTRSRTFHRDLPRCTADPRDLIP